MIRALLIGGGGEANQEEEGMCFVLRLQYLGVDCKTNKKNKQKKQGGGGLGLNSSFYLIVSCLENHVVQRCKSELWLWVCHLQFVVLEREK